MGDREQIIDLACRYTWALDTKDYGALADVFTTDAFARLGGEDCDGLAAIQGRVRRALDHLDVSQHLVGSHVVDIAPDGNADRARHRCQFHAQHVRRAAAGGPHYVVAGTYDDDVVRTDVGWRIAHRVLTVTWTDGNVAVVRGDP